MQNEDPVEAMKAWAVAQAALAKAQGELRAALAAHEVALRCEREAWDKIQKVCGHEPVRPPPQAPPVATPPVMPTCVTAGYVHGNPPATFGTFVQQQQPRFYSYQPGTNVAGLSATGW